jgi:phenylacetate-coenzyme A ligase PaaK-like adenylate-forming protein
MKDSKLAFSTPDQIKGFQEGQLRHHLTYCRQHSPFYRRVMDRIGLQPADMDLNSFSEFPLTAKKDIEAFNDDFCAVPREKIVDIVLSSGTTGKPTRIMYTEADLQRLAYNEKISLAGCGITNSDTALLTCTMDRCFIAGLAYFSGLRGIGAAVIRNGQNTLESHASIIISCGRNTQRLGPIQGRKAQMLKLKGTTLYPQAIFAVLESFDQIEEYYIQVEAQSDLSDQVTLYTAVQSSSLTPETIQNRLQASLRVKPDVKIEPLSSILKKVMSPGSRKPMRFFDNRKN